MIQEDYVSFETAKLLADKGFNEKCRAFYVKSEEYGIDLFHTERSHNFNDVYPPRTSAPTLQMARKWLREKYYIHADPIKQGNYNDCSEYYTWIVACMGIIHRNSGVAEKFSYEEACEAALKYSLENLI